MFVPSGNFKFLGAPFGTATHCTGHTRKGKQKAEDLLKRIRAMPDAQSAMLLIRQCVSFCKLAYSARTVPPGLHCVALQEFSVLLPLIHSRCKVCRLLCFLDSPYPAFS